MFGEIYRFTKDYQPKNMRHVTFHKGNEVVLVHEDSKYEHEFYHDRFRGVIKLDNNVFKDGILEKVCDKEYKFCKRKLIQKASKKTMNKPVYGPLSIETLDINF